jgi:hypothetical protein
MKMREVSGKREKERNAKWGRNAADSRGAPEVKTSPPL